jgi:exodeoxyribonuclease V alpha subunit
VTYSDNQHLPSSAARPSELLQGVVERLTYHSEESGYTVARFKAPRTSELITIVGNFASIQPGQTLHLEGDWREHPKYGPQFQVVKYHEAKPATLTGIEKYLGSGLIKGVGSATAKRIVAYFGAETLEVLEAQIERLSEVPGISQKRVKLIQTAWAEQRAIKDVMLFLQSHGISTAYAVKIFKQYGDASIATVTQNPYQLAAEVYGIGFVTADAIARSLGIDPGSEYRYRSGISHVLQEAAADGHCFLPQAELAERAVKRLAIQSHQPDLAAMTELTKKMALSGELVMQVGEAEQPSICYDPPFYGAEFKLAERLALLLSEPLQLSAQQRQAVEMAASQRVLVLTGGPGTGKTFCTRTIVALWKAMGRSIALASPTGRAAQRLSEMTRQEAKTVHRLLEFDPTHFKFKREAENPIPAEAIVIDEASMLDLFLANSLLKAIELKAQLLLVGDIDQLPSVGPGNVLADLIQSGQIPVVRLSEVFRQAQTSQIVRSAHEINQGQMPVLEPASLQPDSDCLWVNAFQPEQGVRAIQKLVSETIPQLGFEPLRDVQVLCPMIRGEVGTRSLNQVLQQMLNPPAGYKSELVRGGRILREGDRVIQQSNDYNREVFNGDVGSIHAIDSDSQEITVRFAERLVSYDYADLNELELAWAVSIHKSQGSEYPVVILPIYMQHSLLLSRNLIYTGLTRAKQLAIFVGSQKAIEFAVNQTKNQQRYTLLAERLRELLR